MKLTKKIIKKLVEEVLNEQPPQQPAQPADDDKPKPLKIDIPDSPFEPDVNQVKDRLKQILKMWQEKEYSSDEIRWKMYHRDIFNLLKKLQGDK